MSQSASILTAARLAFWDAIDNHAPLNGLFRQKYRYGSARARTSPLEPPYDKREPSSRAVDCPAIRLRPSSVATEWKLNQLQRLPFGVEFKIWANDLDAELIERLLGLVIDAVHTAKEAGASTSYVRAVLGGQIPTFSPIAFQEELIGDGETDNEQPVLTATGVLILPLNYQPVNYNVQ